MKLPRPRRLQIQKHRIVTREQWLALREGDITASVVAALFGLHPYETAMGLFAKHTGVAMPEVEDTIAMRRGRLLENAVAQAFLEEHPGWKINKAHLYARAPKLRLGCTPDFHVIDPAGKKGVLQTKTTAPHVFRRSWTEDTPPTWVTLQALTEMMLMKVELGLIAALVCDGYQFKLYTYVVPRHPAAERRIQDTVEQFWSDIAAGRAPKLDFDRDAALLPIIYPREQPGKVADLRTDNNLPVLLAEREQLKEQLAELEKRRDAIETEVKFRLQDSEAAIVQGWRLTYKLQTRKQYVVPEKSFRVLRAIKDESDERAA